MRGYVRWRFKTDWTCRSVILYTWRTRSDFLLPQSLLTRPGDIIKPDLGHGQSRPRCIQTYLELHQLESQRLGLVEAAS